MAETTQQKTNAPSCLAILGYGLLFLVVIVSLGMLSTNPGAGIFGLVIALALASPLIWKIVRYFRMKKYFASEEFAQNKAAIASVVAEHNDIANYAAWIRDRGLFDLGASTTGTQSHLATYENTSLYNYRRDRNVAQLQARNVHNCSLQIVQKAKADPLTYLMKYFGIKADEENLARVETLGESIARLEDAIANLQGRESSIAQTINPPEFILKHYHDKFMHHMGVHLAPITIPYPVYQFEYVSAGGNSAQRTVVILNSMTIDALIETLSRKIQWRKSAAGQRALMTVKLRNWIKDRDRHTCRTCGISIAAEPHLLLEVDHIMPVSLGGLTTEENLQTLCWRCNRTKSNKLPS